MSRTDRPLTEEEFATLTSWIEESQANRRCFTDWYFTEAALCEANALFDKDDANPS